jgi:hypothetical protein
MPFAGASASQNRCVVGTRNPFGRWAEGEEVSSDVKVSEGKQDRALQVMAHVVAELKHSSF